MCNHTASQTTLYATVAGALAVSIVDEGIIQAVFVDEPINEAIDPASLAGYQLLLCGSDFELKVWEATMAIPAGKTATYQEIAQAIGNPKAYRAVARALASNPIAYFIPCHRVIGSDGSLRGYVWGLERKAALLAAEKATLATF